MVKGELTGMSEVQWALEVYQERWALNQEFRRQPEAVVSLKEKPVAISKARLVGGQVLPVEQGKVRREAKLES